MIQRWRRANDDEWGRGGVVNGMVMDDAGEYVLYDALAEKARDIEKWVRIAGENQRSANLSAKAVEEKEKEITELKGLQVGCTGEHQHCGDPAGHAHGDGTEWLVCNPRRLHHHHDKKCIIGLRREIADLRKRLAKYQAFWEESRIADQMRFEVEHPEYPKTALKEESHESR